MSAHKDRLVKRVRSYIRRHGRDYRAEDRLHKRFYPKAASPEERVLDLLMDVTSITVVIDRETMNKLELVRDSYQVHDEEDIEMKHVVAAMVGIGVDKTIIKEGL